MPEATDINDILSVDIGQEPDTSVTATPAASSGMGPPVGGPSVKDPTYFDLHRGGVNKSVILPRTEEIEAQYEAKRTPVTAMDAIAAGMKIENTVAQWFDYFTGELEKPEFPRVPGYKPDIAGYEDYIDNFEFSGSPQEDAWIKSQIDRERALREEAGTLGLVVGAISDPTAWVAGAASLYARAGVRGIIATETAAAAVTEAQLQAVQESRTATESMFNIAAAGIVTSILGGAGITITKAERAAAERELSRILSNSKTPRVDPDTGEIVPDAVGAQKTREPTLDENTMVGGRVAETMSIGPGSRLMSASVPVVREWAQKLVDMPFAIRKHLKGETVGASVEARLGDYTKMWYRSYEEVKKQWDSYRKSGGTEFKNFREFDNAVGRAMRRGDNSNISQVTAAAKAWRKSVEEVKNRAVEAGALPPNVDVRYAESYFPRALDYQHINDINPFQRVIYDYQIAKGTDADDAWEISMYVGKRLASGSTLPPGVIPIPKASGTKSRSLAITDDHLEAFLSSAASDVLARHFREMGAEIELRRALGVDNSAYQAKVRLENEYERAKAKHEGIMKRYKAAHEDVKLAEMKLAEDSAENSRVGGGHRAYVMPGQKLEETDFPASAGHAPIVSTRRRKGSTEIDLQLENPIFIEDFAKILDLPTGSGVEKLQRVMYMVGTLVDKRIIDRDLAKTIDDLVRNIPRTRKINPKSTLVELPRGAGKVAAPKVLSELLQEGMQSLNQKAAGDIANRVMRMLVRRMREKGHDAIGFTAKGKHGSKFILLEPEKAVRAPTAAEKHDMRRSLRRTMDSYRKMSKREEEWAEYEKWYKEEIKRLGADDENTIQKALDAELKRMEEDYVKLQVAAREKGDEKQAKRLRDEWRSVNRDIRSMVARLQGIHGRPADATNAFTRAGRMLRGLAAATSLGGVVITSLAELVRPVFQYGLAPWAKGMSLMITDFKGWKLTKGELQRMGAALETVTNERLMNWMGEEGIGMMSKSQRLLEKGVGKFTGLSLWTEQVKALTGIIATDKMIEVSAKMVAGTASKNEIAKMARAGIDVDLARKITSEYAQRGDTYKNLRLASTDDWVDRDAALAFEAAVRSEVNMIALEPGMADKWLWTTGSEFGKLIGQFQSFAQGATNRALVSGLQRHDAAFYSGLVVQTMMGGLVMAIKDMSLGKDPTERTPAMMLGGAIDRSGVLGVWQRAFDLAKNLAETNSTENWAEREVVKFLGPVMGRTIPDAASFLGSIPKGDIDVSSGIDLIPYNDVFHIRRLMEQTLEPPWSN